MTTLVRLSVLAFLFLGAVAHPNQANAQTGLFQLRTEPATPIAGQPFDIVAQSGPCVVLLTGDPLGTGNLQYGGVTVAGNTVSAQWGGLNALSCNAVITTVRQTASGLPAGTYAVQLVLQQFPPSGIGSTNESVAETIQIQVANAAQGAALVPASDWAGLCILVGLVLCAGFLRGRSF